MDPSMKIDGEKVRSLREQKSWSQEHLATVAGLSARTVQRVETGGGGLPETRLALAAALGVAASDLIFDRPVEHAASGKGPGARWGWIGWSAGVLCSLTGIFFGFLGNGSWPEALRAVGVVGALAGVTAGIIGVLSERHKRRQTTA
jgi:DNA-binding XRE family transcriptional regulator